MNTFKQVKNSEKEHLWGFGMFFQKQASGIQIFNEGKYNQ